MPDTPGNTAPSAEALAISDAAGLLNMNGGDTAITRSNPSLTEVRSWGLRKGGHLQIYAPVTNENIYTNLWHGPFYGFERVIETFEMTDAPRSSVRSAFSRPAPSAHASHWWGRWGCPRAHRS